MVASSEYNVRIVAIDTAMDCYEHVERAAGDLRAAASFDLMSVGDAISRSISDKEDELYGATEELNRLCEAQERERTENDEGDGGYGGSYASTSYDGDIADTQEQIARLERQLASLSELSARHGTVRDEWEGRSSALLGKVTECSAEGRRMMAAYIRKIQGIDGVGEGDGMLTNPYTGQGGYVVVIIDSQKYPETAEHIRVATRAGQPAYLTLARSGSAERRQQALAGIRSRGADGFDRDEFPPAAFAEGGAGSHVAYMSFADNRGSGSSFSRQLQNFCDGTRVRFRVI